MSPAAKDEKSDTRKRKSGPATPAKEAAVGGAVNSPPSKLSKADTYNEVTKLEEQQSKTRDPAKDGALFSSTCNDMKKTLKEILDLKLKKAGKASSEVNDLRVKTSIAFLTLRKLNRLDKLRTRATREETALAKGKVDNLGLQLQNLLYEVLYLQKEVTKCQLYKSKDEDIELVPLDQFFREAPDAANAGEMDEHQQRIARLQFENSQRKEMNENLRQLEKARANLDKHIREKKGNLASLEPQLKDILEKTKPLQKYLDMPLTEERDQLALAKYLPQTLFVLFRQTKYYGQACDKGIKVTILGDLEEAKSFRALNKNANNDDEDDDGPAEEEDRQTRDKSAKGKPMSAEEQRQKKVLGKHPLTVEVNIKDKDGNNVILKFNHLHVLDVVGVNIELKLAKESKAIQGDREVLQDTTLLSHLLVTDPGNQSPNPATAHSLKEAGLKGKLSNIQLADVGCLYLWAQNLAGLDFPTLPEETDAEASKSDAPTKVDEDISETRVKGIINAIRDRLSSRLALQRQLSLLFKAKVVPVDLSNSIPEELKREFPTRVTSKIYNWTAVDWEKYTALSVTQHLVTSGVVDGHDFFYRLQINRDPATLIALIAVKPGYPKQSAVFCLNLHWEGEHDMHNSEHIRELERLVNTKYALGLDDKHRPEVLILQLQTLLCSLDSLLESWSSLGSGSKPDFPREKIFIHPVRGRTRSLPLRYNQMLQIYSQRI